MSCAARHVTQSVGYAKRGGACTYPVWKEIDGVEYCFAHGTAVLAGTRNVDDVLLGRPSNNSRFTSEMAERAKRRKRHQCAG